MVIIYGTYYAGKVDEVPKVCSVKTNFFHIYYVPLIPLGSMAVLENTGNQIHGVPVGFHLKSILMAWFRTALAIGAVASFVVSCAGIGDNRGVDPIKIAAAVAAFVVCVSLLIATYTLHFFKRASYERAHYLANVLGLNDLGRLSIEIAYGRMNAEQADRELQRREAEAEAAAATHPTQAVDAHILPQ